MTYVGQARTAVADSPAIDAFGRQRTSEPATVFNSKQIAGSGALIWDDAETSGSGTNSIYLQNRASTILTVSNNTAGTRVRQTFIHHNYLSGKSQLVMLTAVMGADITRTASDAGVIRRAGLFNDANGIFFELNGFGLHVVLRSSTTGSVVDLDIPQAAWNVDAFDGTGSSGYNVLPEKTLVFWFDFEWLGAGRVRMGFVFDGIMFVAHAFNNANQKNVAYMSTPNLPLRYEIINEGDGPLAGLEQICSSVMTEGGVSPFAVPRSANTLGIPVDTIASGTIYAVVGIRLNPGALGCRIELSSIQMLAGKNSDFQWMLILNPTVADTFAYSHLSPSSHVDVARGVTANTVTGGEELDSGYIRSEAQTSVPVDTSAVRLGSAIDGTPTELVLCARPMSVISDIQGAINFREIQ